MGKWNKIIYKFEVDFIRLIMGWICYGRRILRILWKMYGGRYLFFIPLFPYMFVSNYIATKIYLYNIYIP